MKTLFCIPLLFGAWATLAQGADAPLASNKTSKTVSTEFEGSKSIALLKSNRYEDSPTRFPEDSIFIAPQQMAQFPGGQELMAKFFGRNLTIPDDLRDKKLATKVFVRFLIQKSGQITNVHLVKGTNDKLNIEAMRVVKMMPPWEPARHFNQSVLSVQTLPVSFMVE